MDVKQHESMCICVQKDHMCMSEFGGLRKHQNDPACPKHVRLKVGHYKEEEEL